MERNEGGERAVDIEAHNADGPIGGFRADAGGVQTPTEGTPVRRATIDGPDGSRVETAAIVADTFNGLHARVAHIERLIGVENADRDKLSIIVATARGDVESAS